MNFYMIMFAVQALLATIIATNLQGYNTKESWVDRLVVVLLWVSLAFDSLSKI